MLIYACIYAYICLYIYTYIDLMEMASDTPTITLTISKIPQETLKVNYN